MGICELLLSDKFLRVVILNMLSVSNGLLIADPRSHSENTVRRSGDPPHMYCCCGLRFARYRPIAAPPSPAPHLLDNEACPVNSPGSFCDSVLSLLWDDALLVIWLSCCCIHWDIRFPLVKLRTWQSRSALWMLLGSFWTIWNPRSGFGSSELHP